MNNKKRTPKKKKKHAYGTKHDSCENCISNTGGTIITAGRYGPKIVAKQPGGCRLKQKYPHKIFTTQSCRFFRRELLYGEGADVVDPKPWHDPESLFCSEQLKEITGKEPEKHVILNNSNNTHSAYKVYRIGI